MTRIIANLLVGTLTFLVVFAATSLARRVRTDLLIAHQIAAGHGGSPEGSVAIAFVCYAMLFCAAGLALVALLRTDRPISWAVSLGTAYALFRLYSGEVLAFYSGTRLYMQLAVECIAPVAGCALGAAGSRWLRRIAPDNSSKPKPLRGAA